MATQLGEVTTINNKDRKAGEPALYPFTYLIQDGVTKPYMPTTAELKAGFDRAQKNKTDWPTPPQPQPPVTGDGPAPIYSNEF